MKLKPITASSGDKDLLEQLRERVNELIEMIHELEIKANECPRGYHDFLRHLGGNYCIYCKEMI